MPALTSAGPIDEGPISPQHGTQFDECTRTSQLLLGFHFIVGKQVFAVGSVAWCADNLDKPEERERSPMELLQQSVYILWGDVLQCFSELLL